MNVFVLSSRLSSRRFAPRALAGRQTAVAILFATFFISTIHADGEKSSFNAQVEELYRNFRENPKEALSKPTPRDYSKALEYKKYLDSLGSNITILKESTHTYHDWTRRKIVKNKSQLLDAGKRPWNGNDDPDLFFTDPSLIEKKIAQLPQTAQLSSIPWSSYYWALKYGSSAARYSLGLKFPTWKDFFNSYLQPQEFDKLERPIADSSKIDFYSPAEKYDILMGDNTFSLTNTLRLQGASFLKNIEWKLDQDQNIIGVETIDGDVEPWMGLCHGWSAASYKAPRPLRGLEVESINGDKVYFHQDDLKSLAVLKYAQSKSESRFVGGRCNIKESNITKDEQTGAILDDDCFDTNPGTFHIIAMNKLSHGESFVIDATYDYEVWNQPVVAATVTYFNPKLGRSVDNMEEAIVPYGFKGDIFKKVREIKRKKTKKIKPKKIVGVAMNLLYIVETMPKQGASLPDQVVEATYLYDLELDKDGNIVGGEWYSNLHPDFIWDSILDFNVWPSNEIDNYLQKENLAYDGSKASLTKILEVGIEDERGEIINAAQLSSRPQSRSSGLGDESPLATVLKYFFELASKKE
ncbi:MAG: hypothetical protein HYS98_02430 [Deltaproteobacteria bacterium]|nr:hypothetical protein [Deltaproteobacteria bacterium]